MSYDTKQRWINLGLILFAIIVIFAAMSINRFSSYINPPEIVITNTVSF